MRARVERRRGKTLSRTKSSKYSTIPTYTAPRGTRTAILATLGYIEEASRKWTKYELESSPKFSPFSTVRFSVKSRSTHVENRMGLRATWLVASNGGAKSLTPFHRGINLKFGIKKTHSRKTIRGKKAHGKIRSTLNVYYIGRKMITRVYLLTAVCVITVSRTFRDIIC